MSNELLFIPSKLRIGFRSRDDTFTQKLAYVIYYDEKKVLRKQKSWDNWRDHAIEPIELDNVPMDGFVINKNVERYNWSHFSNNRSYIRIYDSRGVEFEITPENLIGILMHSDCNRRVLEGKYVYAWSGKELVLLPVNSQEYKNATAYTERLDSKVSAREIKTGLSYKTKKGEDVTYIGRYDWYETCYDKTGHIQSRKKKEKVYIFVDKDEKIRLDIKLHSLSFANSSEIVANYAELCDKILQDIHFYKAEKWNMISVKVDESQIDKADRYARLKYFIKTDKPNIYRSVSIIGKSHVSWGSYLYNSIYNYRYNPDSQKYISKETVDEMQKNAAFIVKEEEYLINIDEQIITYDHVSRTRTYPWYKDRIHTKESILNEQFFRVEVELSNQKSVIVENLSNI